MGSAFAFLAAVGMAVSFASPRAGVFVCLLAGFLADPIRKVIPGQPVFIVAIVFLFFLATFAGVVRTVSWKGLPVELMKRKRIQKPMKFFALVVLLQTLRGFLLTRSPVIAGIGMMVYSAPIPAVIAGSYFARRQREIGRFMEVYSALVVVFLSGVFLSLFGSQSPLLESVGQELFVYSSSTGAAVRLFSGFLRTSEIAAWHGGTAICFLILVWIAVRRSLAFHAIAGLAVVFLAAAVLVTGRRKALAVVLVFVILYAILLLRFRRGAGRVAPIVLAILLISLLVAGTLSISETAGTRLQPYLERGRTTTDSSAWARLRSMTLGSFRYVVEYNGLLGAGAGTGSQGTQNYGGGSDVIGYGAEGGLGKVLAELGVPGLFVLVWLLVTVVREIWRFTREIDKADPGRARLALGLMAFLGANAIEFAAAHQAFGDPFILLILGTTFGFLLALCRAPASSNISPRAVTAGRNRSPGSVAAARPIELKL